MVLNMMKFKKLMLVITKKEGSKYGIEYNELIEDQYQKADEVIEHQKVEDINMVKSSKNESDKIKELGLTMEELRVIARQIGVKNYENLSRIRLVEEIDKQEASKELKKQKIVSSLLLKGKKILDLKQKSKKEPVKISKKIKFEKYKGDDLELKGKDIRKSFRLKKEKKDILGKKRGIEKIRSKKDNKK